MVLTYFTKQGIQMVQNCNEYYDVCSDLLLQEQGTHSPPARSLTLSWMAPLPCPRL